MPEIVLTAEQAALLVTAPGPVTVRDPNGHALGVLDPMDAAALAKHRERKANPGPRLGYSGESMSAMFAALQAERDRIGPFDGKYAVEFVQRLEAEDPDTYGPKEWP